MPGTNSKAVGKKWAYKIYKKLLQQHGKQYWWPADSEFEVMVGAILTQNTAWTNVEKAINNLKSSNHLSEDAIISAKHSSLARLIKPSGYFNVKAKRLKSYCEWYLNNGGYLQMKYWPTAKLRKALLQVNGVGHETADDILLYAFKRPVFVIDAYTRRIFSRLGHMKGDEVYDDLRTCFETQLPESKKLFAEYHSLIVQHGKHICKPNPDCNACSLFSSCVYKKGSV